MIETGHATRAGTIAPSADAAIVHVQADGTLAAAVVDGIGHSPHIADVARILAAVAARTAARRGCLAGLLAATELVADPGAGAEPEPDAVAVVAVTKPGDDRISTAWVGDCRAYALEDGKLQHLTIDHNLATQLEMCGYAGEVVRRAGQWVRTSVATAAVATVAEAWTTADLVLLTSDGVHDQMPHHTLKALALEHQGDPQALAQALVRAAETGTDGVRDDATAVVIRRTRQD
ncbi:SpoIIE family protein phosphatase [Streptomyces sp. NPDC004610]|uniref:PP2C family protein-serine/threonine phosphatase n=1 Tax=unclassified Streptomyces TaxID=2593676 RepID=UPI0033B1DDD7